MTEPRRKRPMNVMVAPELLARIDADREAKGQSRSEWLARAAEAALGPVPGAGEPARDLLQDLSDSVADARRANRARRETVRKPAPADGDVTPIPKRGTRP